MRSPPAGRRRGEEELMVRGRHTEGPDLVRRLRGSEQARHRMRVFLETLSDEKTVWQACEELRLSQAGFYKVRGAWMAAALLLLEPKSVGRPRRTPQIPEEVAKLKARIRDLEAELEASRIRDELALTLPRVRRMPEEQKKTPQRKRTRRS